MPRRINLQGLLRQRRMCDQPQARRRMIQHLAARGINAPVLQAMGAVPRHAFVSCQLISEAYVVRPICVGRTVLTHPYVVAFMTQNLGLNPQKKVLEIGTGTGYHTAILALLSGHVFTIERVPSLVKESGDALAALGLGNVSQKLEDGHEGWPEAAPFDAILVTAAGPTIPQKLVQQLHPQHGRMVIPVGPQGGCQRLYLVQRRGQGIHRTDLGATYFIPFVPGTPAPAAVRQGTIACSPRVRNRSCLAR